MGDFFEIGVRKPYKIRAEDSEKLLFWKGGVPMALTPAMEDYLEAILMIKQQHGYVRCVDVAEQLGVKKPSVSRAVKELIKSGHLVKNADGTLSLTELGLQIAEQIYEKHLFFTKQLILAGVDPETAEQDACGIEHAVSSESFQKLKKAFDDG